MLDGCEGRLAWVSEGAKSPEKTKACAKEITRATAELTRLISSTTFREQEANRLGLGEGVDSGAGNETGTVPFMMVVVLQGKGHTSRHDQEMHRNLMYDEMITTSDKAMVV